eukprot:sb/3474934/
MGLKNARLVMRWCLFAPIHTSNSTHCYPLFSFNIQGVPYILSVGWRAVTPKRKELIQHTPVVTDGFVLKLFFKSSFFTNEHSCYSFMNSEILFTLTRQLTLRIYGTPCRWRQKLEPTRKRVKRILLLDINR